MRIMAKRNETDRDMVELWCRGHRNTKMLMAVVHQDCLSDIAHQEGGGGDLLEGGMMLSLFEYATSKDDAEFWGV